MNNANDRSVKNQLIIFKLLIIDILIFLVFLNKCVITFLFISYF